MQPLGQGCGSPKPLPSPAQVTKLLPAHALVPGSQILSTQSPSTQGFASGHWPPSHSLPAPPVKRSFDVLPHAPAVIKTPSVLAKIQPGRCQGLYDLF
jgi:hypothetical protein